MKLLSVLNVMDDTELVEVADENAPIENQVVFTGCVAECRKEGRIRNGIVTAIVPCRGCLCILVNIEYQKRKEKHDNWRSNENAE